MREYRNVQVDLIGSIILRSQRRRKGFSIASTGGLCTIVLEPSYSFFLTPLYRAKLQDNSSINLPPQISTAIANITEGFSFAYLQEAFVSALLSIVQKKEEAANVMKASNGAALSDSSSDDLDKNPVWQAINEQVQTLRREMKDSRKSVEDSGKNSMLSDAKSNSAVSAGFGLGR